MALHCDTMDGPIVTAAELALEMENVNYVLPFVKSDYEGELKEAFDRTIIVRELSGEAAEVADYWFFETAVRLHLLGRGKPYTGIKQSGLNQGSIIRRAENALESGDSRDLEDFLYNIIKDEFETRFENVVSKKDYDLNDVEAARDYITSMLGFLAFSQKIYDNFEGL